MWASFGKSLPASGPIFGSSLPGGWDIIWTLVGIMDFDTNDYDNPEEFTPAEIDALMITTLSNGMYHAKIDKSFEDEKSGGGHVKIDHIGAYCVNGDDRMIAGNFAVNMTMGDADVKLEGDFLVHKETEDYLETQTEDYGQETAADTGSEVTEASEGTAGGIAQSGTTGSTSGTVRRPGRPVTLHAQIINPGHCCPLKN